MLLTKEIIDHSLFSHHYTVKIISETSEVIIYSVSENDNIYILRYYPKKNKKLFQYIDNANKMNIYPKIIIMYDNGILEQVNKKMDNNYKLSHVTELICKISTIPPVDSLDIEFNDISCIATISLFIKKIIDCEIKPALWFTILEKFSLLVDMLMGLYNKKDNTVCHNNLKPKIFYHAPGKDNIITSNFEHVGVNPLFYELSNYFNNLSTYPQFEERRKYYGIFIDKNDEYNDRYILLYSNISNLYWALWAYLENYELKEKDIDGFYSKMYDYRIKKFLTQ